MPLEIQADPDVGGILPALEDFNAHPATWDEIEEIFVTNAPFFQETRKRLLDTLRVYVATFNALIPETRYFVDGGFLTLKDWEPEDIDVLVATPAGALTSRSDDAWREKLKSLRTQVDTDTMKRSKPMSGLVDASVVDIDDDFVFRHSFKVFTSIKDRMHNEVPGRRKGIVEVIQGG